MMTQIGMTERRLNYFQLRLSPRFEYVYYVALRLARHTRTYRSSAGAIHFGDERL